MTVLESNGILKILLAYVNAGQMRMVKRQLLLLLPVLRKETRAGKRCGR